ncbi:MAG: Bax inhibitor-1/YccA family protein [Alphaproteobacteria bacterium]|nr:Bax inhibitor-1/YccA family protein [Alphaproteobacteria bacterium]
MSFESSRETIFSRSEGREIDVGLQKFMNKVYNFMCIGLLITTIVSYGLSHTPMINLFFAVQENAIRMTALGWVATLAPLFLVFMIAHSVTSANAAKSTILFLIYSACMGVSMTTIFIQYAMADILRVFLICSVMFLSTSLYGYTTRKNLMNVGGYCVMGLFGIIIASIVNIFMRSSGMDILLSYAGVAIFVGLTAWDTQKIRLIYAEGDTENASTSKAIYGAFELYLDFLNMFIYLLRIFGGRDRD